MNNGQNISQELLAKANQELLPTQEKDRTLKNAGALFIDGDQRCGVGDPPLKYFKRRIFPY